MLERIPGRVRLPERKPIRVEKELPQRDPDFHVMRLKDVVQATCAAHLRSLAAVLNTDRPGGSALLLNPVALFPKLESLRIDGGRTIHSKETAVAITRELSTEWQYVKRIELLFLRLDYSVFDSELALHLGDMENLRGFIIIFELVRCDEDLLDEWQTGIATLGKVVTPKIEKVTIRMLDDVKPEWQEKKVLDVVGVTLDSFATTLTERVSTLQGACGVTTERGRLHCVRFEIPKPPAEKWMCNVCGTVCGVGRAFPVV